MTYDMIRPLQLHPQVDMDDLLFGVSVQSTFAELPAQPALLDASERQLVIGPVTLVNLYHTCLQSGRDAVCLLQVFGEYHRSQTIRGVIG